MDSMCSRSTRTGGKEACDVSSSRLLDSAVSIPVLLLIMFFSAVTQSVRRAPRRRSVAPPPRPPKYVFKVKPGESFHIRINEDRTWTKFKTNKGGCL